MTPGRVHTFEEISVGMEFGPLEQLFDEHTARAYAFSVGDYSFFDNGGGLKQQSAAYSAWAAKRLMHLYMLTVFNPAGIKAVHLKEDIELVAPVRIGQHLTMKGHCVGKYLKKGRGMVAIEAEARDEAGNTLIRQRSLEIVPVADIASASGGEEPADAHLLSGVRVSPEAPDAPIIVRPDDYQGEIAALPVMTRTIHQDQIAVFCGANEGWENLHTSNAIAQAAGFARPIMSGLIHSCWHIEQLGRFFGEGVASGMRLGNTYMKPVEADSTIKCHARVIMTERSRWLVKLWNSCDGDIVASGMAEIPA